MARSSRGGSSGERSMPYWMCSCGGWNWDWRASCLSCGYAAPPWATGSAPAAGKPKADKDGWVDQPWGRKAQRQARSAASRAASAKSQTSASAASGAPSGGGVTAIERLQATAEQLEALQAGPPEGVDGSYTSVVASQLESKRAELAKAQQAAAEQKAAAMPRPTLLHKEANAISKSEKRLRAARQDLEQKQVARDLAEAQLQKAQEELAERDGALEEASRALQVLEEAAREEAEARERQRAAEWAGASQVPGLLTQLDKLPEAWASSNFEVAWAAIRAQMEAVRAQLAGPPLAPTQAPRAETCPMDEISSDDGNDGNLAGSSGPWQPQAAAERGQAERYGNAFGEWPQVAQACKRELAAEAADLAPLAARPAGHAAGGRGAGDPPVQEKVARLRGALGPKGVNLGIFAAFGGNELSAGVPWLAQGDFNMEPGTLHELGRSRVQRTTYLGLTEFTCAGQGAGLVYVWSARMRDQMPWRRCWSAQFVSLLATPQLAGPAKMAARQWIQVVECTLEGIHGVDDSDLRRYLGRAEGPMAVRAPLDAAVKHECRHGQVGVLERLEATAEMVDLLQPAELPRRMCAGGLEAAAARRACGAAGRRGASPTVAVVRPLEPFGRYLESERCKVADSDDELEPMLLGPQELSIMDGYDARQAPNRHEKRKRSSDPLWLRPFFENAIGRLLGRQGIELGVREQHVRGAHVSYMHWTMSVCRIRKPADGRLNGKLYLDGSVKDSEEAPPAGERRQAQAATAEVRPLAGAALGVGAPAERPCLQSSSSTGSSATTISAAAVVFSLLGHTLSYACAGAGEDAREIVACSRRGAYKVQGSRA
ncbi:unnamed protein product, partial [Prorocentrum cordatum]